jgi:hypothetical protein
VRADWYLPLKTKWFLSGVASAIALSLRIDGATADYADRIVGTPSPVRASDAERVDAAVLSPARTRCQFPPEERHAPSATDMPGIAGHLFQRDRTASRGRIAPERVAPRRGPELALKADARGG